MSISVYPPQIIEETNLGIQRFDIRDAMLASRAYYADFATPFHVPLLHRSAVG